MIDIFKRKRSKFLNLFVCLFETGSHFVILADPELNSMHQTGLKLNTPGFKGMYHHIQLQGFY